MWPGKEMTETPSIPCRLFALHSELMQNKSAPEHAAKLAREAGTEILRLLDVIEAMKPAKHGECAMCKQHQNVLDAIEDALQKGKS